MNKRVKGVALTGGSSLLVIFAVLCLTVFALLTISTVNADRRLADASVRSVEAFYRADCEAEEILARLRAGDIPAGVTEQDGVYSYHCPVSDTQALCVQVIIEGETYRVLQWKVVPTAEWSPEEYIEVWVPETEE